MSKISAKKLKQINSISFIHDVIKDTEKDSYYSAGENHWVDTPPDMWMQEQKDIYDRMIELEGRIIKQVINILTN